MKKYQNGLAQAEQPRPGSYVEKFVNKRVSVIYLFIGYYLFIYLFIFIYSFILRAPPIWSEMSGRIKFPEFSLRL